MIKATRITEQNRAAIVAILASVNGKATAHTWTTFGDIEYLALVAEKQLLDLVGSQKAAVGARFNATSGGKVANAYKYARSGTSVTIERRSTGWFLIEASEATLYADGGGARRLTLTAEQDKRAVELFRAGYSVAPAVVIDAVCEIAA
jgi:hypothetical protein